MNRLDVHYVSILYGSTTKDIRTFKSYIQDDYPWMTGEVPNLFRRFLLTPVCYSLKQLDQMLTEQRIRREQGELEWLMFDSGGFQTLRHQSYTMNRLIKDNLYLYKKYPFADSYVMPDLPAPPSDSIFVMEDKIEKSIDATKTLFDRLPSNLKSKASPVFHARAIHHIDRQYEAYRHILDESNMACYAIGGTNKRFSSDHIRNVRYLNNKLPNLKIHLLGVAVPAMIWCMAACGINTYDALTPTAIAARGMISLPYRRANYSIRLENNISDGELKTILKETNHRCPFCDNLNKLKSNTNYRRFHNAIIYDELNYFYKNMSTLDYSKLAPKCYKDFKSSFETEYRQKSLF